MKAIPEWFKEKTKVILTKDRRKENPTAYFIRDISGKFCSLSKSTEKKLSHREFHTRYKTRDLMIYKDFEKYKKMEI